MIWWQIAIAVGWLPVIHLLSRALTWGEDDAFDADKTDRVTWYWR